MLRLHQKLISFSVVSSKIAHNSRDIKKDRLLSLYPIVGQTDIKLGTMTLNQPNNQNFLTIEMIDQLFRFMTSYQHDHSVQNIWLQNQGTMFCAGVSFHQLTNNPDYLDKLYKMTALIAKMNKPIFAYVKGGVRNVGAYILSNASVIMTDKSATMRIDQVSKGFVPIAGGVHRLSRIPAKLGLYLALTGTKLSSDQMSRLGFINAIKKQGVSSKTIRSQMSRSNLFFNTKLQVAYQDQRDLQTIQDDKIGEKKNQLNNEIAVNQNVILTNNKNIFEKFAMNQYKIAQIDYQNVINPFNSFSEKPGRTINNYFMMRHQKAFKYLQNKDLVQASNYKDVRLAGVPLDKVLYVFGQDTLAESIKILQADQSDWAKETLKKIRTMDPLAAVLTFEMLQRGQHLSWDQCLEMEYTVAKRLLNQSIINLKQTYSGSKYIFVNNFSGKKVQDINHSEVISEFFNPIKTFEQKLELDVPTFALLPTVDYQKIPDSARLALNQIFFNDIHLPNQEREVRRYFDSQKLDYRHKSFEVDAVRQQIYRKHQVEKVINRQSKRIELLVNNTSTMNKIVQGKTKFIDSIQDKVLEKYIQNLTKEVFNQGIKDRFDEFSTTAETIGKQNKLKIFKNFRKTLINKIIVNGANLEQKQFSQNQSFRGPVYFDQHGRSIHESRNPYVKNNQQLKKLSDQLENRTISQQFKENQGTQPIDKHFGINKFKDTYEDNMTRIKHNIAKRYQQQPFSWDRAQQLEQMIKGAAQTSEQLAQYIQWDTSAYYNLILSAPGTPRTYNQMGERYVNLMQVQREITKKQMKQTLTEQNRLIDSYFSELYPSQTQGHYKPNKIIIDELLPKGLISKELEKCFVPLMEHVVKGFQQKYYEEGLHQKKVELGEFDNYLYQNIDKQFVNVYKYDIIFVYSYLTILKVKDILHNLQIKGGVDKLQNIQDFFRNYAIEFAPDQDVDSINKILSNFLYAMLDLHTFTKGKVVLPQSKLLDFMNRTKILRESNKKSLHPLSFESIMLMVGKDRTKLYNKIIREYLPVEPQYLLEISKQVGNDFENKSSKNDTIRLFTLFENAVAPAALQRKSMIAGYQYYLALFDSIVQKVSGKYNFANDQMLSNDPEKTRTQLGNLLNMKQTNEQWMDRVSRIIIKNIMNVRLQIEKNLTKGQLYAFDQEWREFLMPDQFKLYLKYYLQSEIQDTKGLFRQTRNYSYEIDISQKHEEAYCNIRRSVKNPGAFRMLNNLKLAMDVHHDYIMDAKTNKVSQEEKEDLVQDRREFTRYQRFPKQTYRRIRNQVFSYGEEKNFDLGLSNLGEKQMHSEKHLHRMQFTDKEDTKQKRMKFTQFQDEIRTLKHTLAKKESPQIDTLYKKIEQLM